jgi:hypothetical protein
MLARASEQTLAAPVPCNPLCRVPAGCRGLTCYAACSPRTFSFGVRRTPVSSRSWPMSPARAACSSRSGFLRPPATFAPARDHPSHPAAVNAVAFAPAGHGRVSGAVGGSLLITHDESDPVALPTTRSGGLASGGISSGVPGERRPWIASEDVVFLYANGRRVPGRIAVGLPVQIDATEASCMIALDGSNTSLTSLETPRRFRRC